VTETTNQGHSPSWAAETESAKWIFEISVFCRLTKYEFEESCFIVPVLITTVLYWSPPPAKGGFFSRPRVVARLVRC